MLAYFMTSPGSIQQSLYQPEQPAQQHSQQQVLVRAQQLAAAASSNYQPGRCCHSTKHQEAPPQAGSAGAQ
jgi:hypothetical protein